jgi:hypothetical protein
MWTAVPGRERLVGLAVADHDHALANEEGRVHHAVPVLGLDFEVGNVAKAHDSVGLGAERAFVEFDCLLGGSVEVEVWIEFLDFHGFLLYLRPRRCEDG